MWNSFLSYYTDILPNCSKHELDWKFQLCIYMHSFTPAPSQVYCVCVKLTTNLMSVGCFGLYFCRRLKKPWRGFSQPVSCSWQSFCQHLFLSSVRCEYIYLARQSCHCPQCLWSKKTKQFQSYPILMRFLLRLLRQPRQGSSFNSLPDQTVLSYT